MSVHHKPEDYGYDPHCVICGLKILEDEGWEGDPQGVRHRMNYGCLRAVGREINAMKAQDDARTNSYP